MLSENRRRFILTVVLATLAINVTVGIIHNLRIKKLLTGKGESIELTIDTYDETDTDDGWLFTYAHVPDGISFLSLFSKSAENSFYCAQQFYKQQSENRLYILFHQLKLHIASGCYC